MRTMCLSGFNWNLILMNSTSNQSIKVMNENLGGFPWGCEWNRSQLGRIG